MTKREGLAVQQLLNFLFWPRERHLLKYDVDKLEDECALLASSPNVPGWTAKRVHDHWKPWEHSKKV